ncbi:16S rRNA (guanine(527)-N(7))-methyltransferase RsmG [Nitratifractor sp.]
MRSEESFQKLLRVKLDEAGLGYDETLPERLGRFGELLREWNTVHNLTADASPEAVVANIVDSLYPLTFVEQPDSLLDVGTGAGFPGLILAAAWPEVPAVLCEPRAKRAAFLRLAALEMGLYAVEVARVRVESLDHSPFGLISSRAVADAATLLELTARLRRDDTRLLLYKGERAEEESRYLTDRCRSEIRRRGKRQYLLVECSL